MCWASFYLSFFAVILLSNAHFASSLQITNTLPEDISNNLTNFWKFDGNHTFELEKSE